jgi:putative oxidoreductase
MSRNCSIGGMPCQDIGLLMIRAMVGFVFVFHGGQKLFGWWEGAGMEGFISGLEKMQVPSPMIAAWLAALAEFGGGLALIAGLGTRIAAVPLVFTMAVAAFKAHAGKFSAQVGGMEYPLTLGIVSLGILFTGPGRISVDQFIRSCCFRQIPDPS